MSSTSGLGSWDCNKCGASVPWNDKRGEFVEASVHRCKTTFTTQIVKTRQMTLKVITGWYRPDWKPLWNRPGSYLTRTASYMTMNMMH